MIVRPFEAPCPDTVCGYRDESYDDAGTGGGFPARLETGGSWMVLLFFAVVVGWGMRGLRVLFSRRWQQVSSELGGAPDSRRSLGGGE